jgi:hypothetical protein
MPQASETEGIVGVSERKVSLNLTWPVVILTGLLAAAKMLGLNISWIQVFIPVWLVLAFFGFFLFMFIMYWLTGTPTTITSRKGNKRTYRRFTRIR